jgi:hypothetical protein
MDRQERCKKIVSAINQLGQTEIDELFKLLHKNKCEYTRNSNGIFVNLSWLSESMIEVIEKYVEFCHQSRTEVCKYESLCEVLNKNFAHATGSIPPTTKVVAKPTGVEGVSTESTTPTVAGTSRVSSSMRFYLLKKKYAKQINSIGLQNIMKNDLRPEAYVIQRT